MAAFLVVFTLIFIFLIGWYIYQRVGDEEDWGGLSLEEIDRLSAHILFWLLITAIAGWFIWSTALTGCARPLSGERRPISNRLTGCCHLCVH